MVTMTLSCIISEIKRDGRKLRFFHTLAFDAAVRGCRRNIAITFGMKKTRTVYLPMVKKFDDMFSCFDTQHLRVTDSPRYASRGKNRLRQAR